MTVALLALAGTPAAGQLGPDLPSQQPATAAAAAAAMAPARKHPVPALWFWLQPQRQTPAAQLAWAQELEQRGEKRAALKQYDRLVHRWHESPEAPRAQRAVARLLSERKRYRAAFDEYQYLVEHFSGRFPYLEVLKAQLSAAVNVAEQRHGGLFLFKGFEAPERALPLLEQILDNAPAWEQAADIGMRIGVIHEQRRDIHEAIAAYETILARHEHTDVAPAAAFRRALCLSELADRSSRDERACRQACSALARFIARYPAAVENISAARERLAELTLRLGRMYLARAEFYRKTGRHDAALIAYGDFIRRFSAAAAPTAEPPGAPGASADDTLWKLVAKATEDMDALRRATRETSGGSRTDPKTGDDTPPAQRSLARHEEDE